MALLTNQGVKVETGSNQDVYQAQLTQVWRRLGLDVLKTLFSGIPPVKDPFAVSSQKAALYVEGMVVLLLDSPCRHSNVGV